MKKQLERITEELGKRGKDAERAEDNHGGETLSSSSWREKSATEELQNLN